jgi:hypothetical protein
MSAGEAQGALFGAEDAGIRMLTVRQPWAWALIHAGKDVENRGRYMAYRGLLVVHAGLSVDRDGEAFLRGMGIRPPAEAFEGGHITGTVQVTGCTSGSASPWAHPGAWHIQVTGPVAAVRRVKARGHLPLVPPPAGWRDAFTA